MTTQTSYYFDPRVIRWRAKIRKGALISSPTFHTEAEARRYIGLAGGCTTPACPKCLAGEKHDR